MIVSHRHVLAHTKYISLAHRDPLVASACDLLHLPNSSRSMLKHAVKLLVLAEMGSHSHSGPYHECPKAWLTILPP